MKRPTITRARQIEGWMTLRELQWLGHAALQSYSIVEVGVYAGRSIRCLADNTPGRVYGVDHWLGTRTSRPQQRRFSSPEKRTAFLDKMQRSLQDHIETGKITLLEMGSEDAVPWIRELTRFQGGVDMIFLDGDHSYEAVSADIARWLPLLRPGGRLCGHDLLWDSVRRAVQDSLENWKCPTSVSNIWTWQNS